MRTNADARAAVERSLWDAGAWTVSEYTVPGASSFVGLRAEFPRAEGGVRTVLVHARCGQDTGAGPEPGATHEPVTFMTSRGQVPGSAVRGHVLAVWGDDEQLYFVEGQEWRAWIGSVLAGGEEPVRWRVPQRETSPSILPLLSRVVP